MCHLLKEREPPYESQKPLYESTMLFQMVVFEFLKMVFMFQKVVSAKVIHIDDLCFKKWFLAVFLRSLRFSSFKRWFLMKNVSFINMLLSKGGFSYCFRAPCLPYAEFLDFTDVS